MRHELARGGTNHKPLRLDPSFRGGRPPAFASKQKFVEGGTRPCSTGRSSRARRAWMMAARRARAEARAKLRVRAVPATTGKPRDGLLALIGATSRSLRPGSARVAREQLPHGFDADRDRSGCGGPKVLRGLRARQRRWLGRRRGSRDDGVVGANGRLRRRWGHTAFVGSVAVTALDDVDRARALLSASRARPSSPRPSPSARCGSRVSRARRDAHATRRRSA